MKNRMYVVMLLTLCAGGLLRGMGWRPDRVGCAVANDVPGPVFNTPQQWEIYLGSQNGAVYSPCLREPQISTVKDLIGLYFPEWADGDFNLYKAVGLCQITQAVASHKKQQNHNLLIFDTDNVCTNGDIPKEATIPFYVIAATDEQRAKISTAQENWKRKYLGRWAKQVNLKAALEQQSAEAQKEAAAAKSTTANKNAQSMTAGSSAAAPAPAASAAAAAAAAASAAPATALRSLPVPPPPAPIKSAARREAERLLAQPSLKPLSVPPAEPNN